MSSVRNIRYKYRRQFLPTAAVSMKQNHNTIDAIDHKHANSWPFLTVSSVAEKTNWLAIVERLFWQLGTCVSGRCRCGEV